MRLIDTERANALIVAHERWRALDRPSHARICCRSSFSGPIGKCGCIGGRRPVADVSRRHGRVADEHGRCGRIHMAAGSVHVRGCRVARPVLQHPRIDAAAIWKSLRFRRYF